MHNRELLNRLQASDLHAFTSLQHNTGNTGYAETEVYPRSDEAEARIMMEQFGGLEGIGEVIYSQEELGLMDDLGANFNGVS